MSDTISSIERVGSINESVKDLHDLAVELGVVGDAVYPDQRKENQGKMVVVSNVVIGSMSELIARDAELSRAHFLGRQGLEQS